MKDKMTLIFFSGTMDKAIAMLILATTAASMEMEVSVFFTFWGLNFLKKGRKDKMDEGKITSEIGKIKKDLDRLQEEKGSNKKVKIVTRVLVLVVFLVFAFLLYKQIHRQATAFDMKELRSQVAKEMLIMQPEIEKEINEVMKTVYPVYIDELKKDRILDNNDSTLFEGEVKKIFSDNYSEEQDEVTLENNERKEE